MGAEGLIALLLSAAPAGAAELPIAESALLTAAEPERIARYVRQLGRPATLERDSAGDPSIATGFGGYPAQIWFFDCDAKGGDCLSVRLQLGIGSDAKLTPAQVNAFNAERRFATLSLDAAGDPILAHDISMPRPGISAAAFADAFRVFDDQAQALVALLRDADRPAKAR